MIALPFLFELHITVYCYKSMADISNATDCIKVYDKCDKTNCRYLIV